MVGKTISHEKGVVHRDIKSANLMVTPQDQVKIMDFGLAQLAERSQLTKTTTMLGTPAYMSPEQAQRLPTGRRTDIWSLGMVIYEMVTGRLPFEGERQEAVLYAISNQEPEPITALRAGLPMDLEFIVGKALAKDPAERYQHVEEMIVDLRAVSQGLGSESLPRPSAAALAPPARRASSFRRVAVAAGLVLAGVLAGAVSGRWGRSVEQAPQPPLRRFTLAPSNLPFDLGEGARASISPNGDAIAYFSRGDSEGGNLWLWDLAKDEARDLGVGSGTGRPRWSPDGRFISVGHDWKLQRIPVRGGPAVKICDFPRAQPAAVMGHTWNPDGTSIVFSSGRPLKLYEVSSGGGEPQLLIESTGPDETLGVLYPEFLPATQGRRLLAYSLGSEQQSRLVVEDLDSHQRVLLGDGARAAYSPTGHLVYQTSLNAPGLMAIPFSLDRSQATGEAFSIAASGFSPSFAADGTMVYLEVAGGQKQLGWWDRAGKKLADIGQPQRTLQVPSLSPDGRLVGVEGVEDETGRDVWLHEVGRPVKRRLTMHPAQDSRAVWTPDGKFVTFFSQRNGTQDIFMMPADGSGEARLIYSSIGYWEPHDWSPDGKSLLCTGAGFPGIGYLEQEADGSGYEPTRYTQTDAWEWWGTFSPDGRYVAYCSNESGRWEVYVRPFPGGPGKEQVSINGGTQVRWSRDGKELFYVESDTLVAVKVTTRPEFAMGAETRLFSSPNLVSPWPVPNYDVAADGKRFVMIERVGNPKPPVIRVVENWFEEFRNREQD